MLSMSLGSLQYNFYSFKKRRFSHKTYAKSKLNYEKHSSFQKSMNPKTEFEKKIGNKF